MKQLLLVAAAMLGLTATSLAQNVPSYVPSNGLVGWWPFNGNANDESGNNNNGSINGGTYISDRNGFLNSALGLPNLGNNSMVGNVAPQFNNLGLSLSVWLRLPNQYNQSTLAVIKNGVPYNNGNGFDVAIDQNNQAYGVNNYRVYFFAGNTNVNFTSNHSELGQWSHIVSTYDGNSIKIYLNGILKATQSFNLSLNCPNNDLIFGQWDNPTTPSVTNRNIDDIGIWNRALTQQEITNLYNAPNCSNNTTITPQTNSLTTGSTANFTATTSDPNPSFVWQSDFGQGFQTLNNFGNYSGVNTASIHISNVQLSEHNQPIRVITTSGNCIDTSNVASILVSDTCITTMTDTSIVLITDTNIVTVTDTNYVTIVDTNYVTITDTSFITVTDTLLIQTTITGINPPNNSNTLRVFPNPTNDHITIDYGNFGIMNGYQLKIENSLGQQVFQTNITQQSDYISLMNWGGNGLYFVRIIDPQGNTIDIRKIVLQ